MIAPSAIASLLIIAAAFTPPDAVLGTSWSGCAALNLSVLYSAPVIARASTPTMPAIEPVTSFVSELLSSLFPAFWNVSS